MHDCAFRTTRGPLRIFPTSFFEPSPRFCQLVARVAHIFYCPSQKWLSDWCFKGLLCVLWPWKYLHLNDVIWGYHRRTTVVVCYGQRILLLTTARQEIPRVKSAPEATYPSRSLACTGHHTWSFYPCLKMVNFPAESTLRTCSAGWFIILGTGVTSSLQQVGGFTPTWWICGLSAPGPTNDLKNKSLSL